MKNPKYKKTAPRKANPKQIKEVYRTFGQYKDIFPHLRYDYLQRKIENNQCIFDSGVAITYTVYKRKVKIGSCVALQGDAMIHQIANIDPSNGNSKDILTRFLNNTVHGKRTWLSVRCDNDRACRFYEKMKFKKIGDILWMKGLLTGYVFCYDPNNLEDVL